MPRALPIGVLHSDLFALNLLARKVVLQRNAALDLKSQRQKSCTKGHREPKRDAECPDCRRHRDLVSVDSIERDRCRRTSWGR